MVFKQETLMERETPPLHGKFHFKYPFCFSDESPISFTWTDERHGEMCPLVEGALIPRFHFYIWNSQKSFHSDRIDY